MRRLLLAAAACGGGFALFVLTHLYRGPDLEPPRWDPSVDRARVVAEARQLIGRASCRERV